MTDNAGSNGADRVAPNSSEAEEAVLGSILINPEAILEVAAFLQPSDFFIVRNAWVYEAICAVQERGEAIDNLTVIQELQNRSQLESIGGSAYITRLINNTPTHIHAETYGRIVERTAIRRRLLTAAGEIAQVALEEDAEIDDVIEHAERTLFAVTERRQRREMIPIQIAASDYFDRIEFLYNHQDEPLGLPTGFTDLDHLLGGLQRSDLCIVAARPGVGKTSFMLSTALNAARRQGAGRIAIFSMEMSTEQLIQRLISAETNINSQKLRLGNMDEFEWGKFGEAIGRIGNLSVFMDDTPAVSVPQMRAKSRRLYREYGLDLIIVDYLQLMSGGVGRNENRVQEISAISRGLKELARELNVPVLAAAQLSRAVEQRADKRPQLSDLRESGCLAGDTLVYLPDSGRSVPIRELAGQSGFEVLSLNPDTYRLESARVNNAFCTGTKPVYRLTTQLGRTISATANHKFLTVQGWKRLDELVVQDYIAVPSTTPLTPIPFSPRKRRERGDPSTAYAYTLGGLKLVHNGTLSDFAHSTLTELTQHWQPDPSIGLSDVTRFAPFPSACVGERAGDRGAMPHSLNGGKVEWDQVASIEPDGESVVYDLTVPGLSNFVANNVIVHNSIEQDADIVMFIYRDDMYDENSERQNQADIIVAKHRNGPTGVITLFFRKEITQFTNMQKSNINLEGF